MPGVYDALGARLARTVGFDALFQTGYGVSAATLGRPDYGFIGASETIANATRVCAAAQCPVIVDADTGYGNALSVWSLVQNLERAGATGMFLEDQKWPKRCGHMAGKEIIEYDEYAQKLGASLDARSSRDFIIVARTDARATSGIDEAIERGRANKKLGADVIFVEAPQDITEMKKIGRAIKGPLVANMIEGGCTPIIPAKTLYSIGFNIVLYPLSVLFSSAYGTLETLKELRKTGSTKRSASSMVNFEKFNKLVEIEKYERLEKRYSS